MPLYEYRCEACGHECEVLQGIREAELTLCPNCAEPKLHRVVSRVSFRLKGGGWYETDFKKDGDKKRNLAGDAGGGAPAAAPAAAAAPAPTAPVAPAASASKPSPSAGD